MSGVGLPSREGQPKTVNGRRPEENHVSSTSVSCVSLCGAALQAGFGRTAGDGDLLARAAVPCGNAVAPPELARNAPVVDVAHPLEVGLRVHLRGELNVALADGGDGLVCERLDPDEPLLGEARLDD